MLTTLALLVVSAAPPVDSQWTWTIDDRRTMKMKSAPKGMSGSINPHLEGVSLDITALEAGEDALRKYVVSVKSGNPSLRGRKFEVESNYGDPMVKDLTPKDSLRLNGVTMPNGDPAPELPAFKRALGLLLRPDGMVVAARGTKCTPETGAAVAKAMGEVMIKLTTDRPDGQSVRDAAGTCVGADGSKYAVTFTLNTPFRDQEFDMTVKGTVTVPAGAWRASWDVNGTLHIDLATGGKPIQVDGTMRVQSGFTAKKK